jgi:hypothetical protein
MLEGSCLCGAVTYVYHGSISEIAMCHCSQCRRAQGGAFATNSPVNAEQLEFTGNEYIKEFQSTDNKVRAFCTNCGSALYSARKDLPSVKRLRLGTVSTEFTCSNKYHIWAGSKAAWHEITDQHPQHREAKE